MDELPELAFELVLRYLNLEDRLKARGVSRRWYHKINSFHVKSLCYSEHPIRCILGKSRCVSGAFADNFINSTRFATFFDTYDQTILSSLKHLRLGYLNLSKGDQEALVRTLNSFGQLEQLDIVRTKLLNQQGEFTLFDLKSNLQFNLPMLISLQLEKVDGIQKLTLEAPRLREVTILGCSLLRVEIVHGELVERLLVERLEYTDVKNLKNLLYLYVKYLPDLEDDSKLLSSLQQLKEFHTNDFKNVSKLFEQKQQSGRADLKIYLCGLLLDGPDDPAINSFRDSSSDYLSGESLVCLAENSSRLADEIPFYRSFNYWAIEAVAPGLEVDLLKRFTDLYEVAVNRPVQDIERFLDLPNLQYISSLEFWCNQQQDLFDRLPEHSIVQKLLINWSPSDLAFLFRLKHLIHLNIRFSIDSETARRALEELPVLSKFEFHYDHKTIRIRIDQSKQFIVCVFGKEKTASDLNALIKFIFGNEKKRNANKLQ